MSLSVFEVFEVFEVFDVFEVVKYSSIQTFQHKVFKHSYSTTSSIKYVFMSLVFSVFFVCTHPASIYVAGS